METPEFLKLPNLAAAKFGAEALYATDDFFAEKENLLKDGRGIFIADKYTENGKWMDGWESRRKRVAGHDWCIIKLGASGVIAGVDVDTNHFLGNHPPFASIEACYYDLNASAEDIMNDDNLQWEEILPKSPLDPGSQHYFNIDSDKIYTHLKLHIYPDGGVARLKVYGEVFKNWDEVGTNTVLDLASANNGGQSILCNDMFFSHMENLIMPNRGKDMSDGWETKRNRTPNNRDWVIVQLAHAGKINDALVDTCHFKGNYPDTCSIDAIKLEEGQTITIENVDKLSWTEILPKQKLQAHHEHPFQTEHNDQVFTHVRLNMYPDGGISRLRLNGTIVK
ncbi:MAG: allantoicase [Aureispira sp.]|nr:allantoicase [Aureispira sp.]